MIPWKICSRICDSQTLYQVFDPNFLGDLDWMVKNFDNPFLSEKFVTWLQKSFFCFPACGLCMGNCRPSVTWGQQSQALRICGPCWIWLCYASFHQLILLTNIWHHMNHMTWAKHQSFFWAPLWPWQPQEMDGSLCSFQQYLYDRWASCPPVSRIPGDFLPVEGHLC